jgi:hypothetical protein
MAAGGALALALLGAAAGLATPAHAAAGDPSQWGLTRHVNEYEGQHRLAAEEPEPGRPPKGGCSACH